MNSYKTFDMLWDILISTGELLFSNYVKKPPKILVTEKANPEQ